MMRAAYAKVEEGEYCGTLAYNPETDARYKPTPTNPLVYHFHGHMAWPASLVVTEDDYFEFLLNLAKEPPPFVLPCIDKGLGDGELLFLGYKLRDWDFRVLLRLLANTLREGAHSHIAVQLGPRSRAEAADQRKAENAKRYLGTYLDKRYIKVFWGTCQEFIAELNRRRA
jgi:SIR2-like protein